VARPKESWVLVVINGCWWGLYHSPIESHKATLVETSYCTLKAVLSLALLSTTSGLYQNSRKKKVDITITESHCLHIHAWFVVCLVGSQTKTRLESSLGSTKYPIHKYDLDVLTMTVVRIFICWRSLRRLATKSAILKEADLYLQRTALFSTLTTISGWMLLLLHDCTTH